MPSPPAHPERGAWDAVRDGWAQVYGSFPAWGVSVETHDFALQTDLDWARSFHEESVELCLNLGGRAVVSHGHETVNLPPHTGGLYAYMETDALRARRLSGERHRFVTVEFHRRFLTQTLAGTESAADPIVQDAVFDRRARSGVSPARRLSEAQQTLALSLARPPVVPAAFPLWYQSKVLEAVAVFLIAPAPELFCARQQRLGRERVERVRAILKARLADPPTLEELGREVGVSPFYLSRTFAQQAGMTIPQYLRRTRMERAAELLRAGRHNVTEAAFAVGYSSLGHFSKSFCEIMGCCPALYPLEGKRSAQSATRGKPKAQGSP